ncbi:glycoside hydrolase family 29 protein [Armillaria novae-zelandiae]|uniref:alpha-L-fucosidase n=1 Tax=Armillaria novae-zelandiae TaxID=153914 RepID=A0AA39NTI3_9AGAR|nr:glycoside hydrolase family 29 protein [Armillaria novae-zelandiae]
MILSWHTMIFLATILFNGILVCGASALPSYPSIALSLRSLFNNQAASPNGSADFDGKGSCFDSQFLSSGPYAHDGIIYDLPNSWGSSNDNLIADSQLISLPEPTFVQELHFVYAGDAGQGTHEFVANFILTFTDNSTQQVQLYARNWWRWPILNIGMLQTPYHFENGTQKNWNSSHIFQWSSSVSSEHALQSITLPPINTAHRLHLFAMSISPSTASLPEAIDVKPALSIRRARFTSRWEDFDGVRAQAVEVTLANLLPTYTLSAETSLNSKHQLYINGAGIKTIYSGVIHRLVPGDQVTVDVFISGARENGSTNIEIRDSNARVIGVSSGWLATPMVEHWTPDAQVLGGHETPTWWNRAKYGIFIHWGIYSVPAWATSSNYAESYDWFLHTDPGEDNPTWSHHLETYGTDVVYDDFISNFTASKFNASEWLDLFDNAGAKYFVLVTKHHDGFSLFDTGDSTHRSSVHLGPKRDFVAELLDTAKKEKPDMYRGTYYSLPEWFSPDYSPYGFGAWPGGLAHNAFDGLLLDPYTGRLNITDYIEDIQLPHMLDLAKKYETNIMWCDIGGPNKTLEFTAEFYNNAFAQGRQVTINNRCGAVPDFDTPEYATFGAIQTRKWEASEGMDPHSYGLNLATNASSYKNATYIVQTLVDIVSKNGNFLLDVGPTAEGEIIAPMKTGLLGAGEWLKYAGKCVYNTNYWFPGSQDIYAPKGSTPVRFTATPTTFCVITFVAPTFGSGQLVVNQRLPILPGDEIYLLNPSGSFGPLPWTVNETTGNFMLDVSGADMEEIKHAWAFQVQLCNLE